VIPFVRKGDANVGNKAGLGILVAALLAAAVVAPAAAQSSATSTVGLTRTATGSFSLDVDGADLRTVLRAIAEFSGRNIVLGQNARGVVRITLKNVAWQDALRRCYVRTVSTMSRTAPSSA